MILLSGLMIFQKNCVPCASSVASLVCSLLLCPLSHALSVDEAVVFALKSNNSMRAQYQNTYADGTGVDSAYAQFLPTVVLSHDHINVEANQTMVNGDTSNSRRRYGASITQPIFNWGGSIAQLRSAKSIKKASEYKLLDSANEIAVSAVQAYEDVLTTREIYKLSVYNHDIFEKYLEFTRVRFDAGVVTMTDVLQAEVRLADAAAQKDTAYASMINAEALFERVIGMKPDSDMEPVALDSVLLPATVDELLELALDLNPQICIQKEQFEASKHNVNTAVSKVMPSVSASANITRSNQKIDPSYNANTYLVQFQVPIFQGGAEYAAIKKSKYLSKSAEFSLDDIKVSVKRAGISAWNQYQTAKTVVKARKSGITAAEKALEGVKEEVNVGTRTTIDLLNAQKELFDANVAHRKAERDLVLSQYSILQVIGHIQLVDEELKNG